jgi:adenosylcobinamide amidohydrolase
MTMIDGVTVQVDGEAVVVRAGHALHVLSSAVVGGGLAQARAIVNVHVPKGFREGDCRSTLTEFTQGRGIPPPYVGLLTAAFTEKAQVVTEQGGDVTALAVATVGLSNPVSAGITEAQRWQPSTINAILVVDATLDVAALVNLVVTVTEAKALALAEAGVRSLDGQAASGTSTDAVVVAATGRGARHAFGGPASALGAVAARAMRRALVAGIHRWVTEHP